MIEAQRKRRRALGLKLTRELVEPVLRAADQYKRLTVRRGEPCNLTSQSGRRTGDDNGRCGLLPAHVCGADVTRRLAGAPARAGELPSFSSFSAGTNE